MNTAHISSYRESPHGHNIDIGPSLGGSTTHFATRIGTTTLTGFSLDSHRCTIVSDCGFYQA